MPNMYKNVSNCFNLNDTSKSIPMSGNNYNPAPLGLFAVCSPLGPLPSLNGLQRDATFKTKHKLDLNLTNIDAR